MATTDNVFKKPEYVQVYARGFTSEENLQVKAAFDAKRKLKGAIRAVIAQNRFGLIAAAAAANHSDQETVAPDTSAYDARYKDFLEKYPDFAEHAEALDAMRKKDFARLDDQSHVYVDYTGGSLFPACIVEQHSKLLMEHVLGNPHSTNPTSFAATELVEATRHSILEYVNADPKEYALVFTLNATGALKLIAESFPFSADSKLLLSVDNHNSVGGIREHAARKGATVLYAPLDDNTLRHDEQAWDTLITKTELNPNAHNLFAFPGQSNFSGVKHPLALANKAKEAGWTVLVDTAAYMPTNKLDLSVIKADFATISFYKMFGYPTGLGALIARKDALEILRNNKPWFCGGVVSIATLNPPAYILAPYEAAFEEGTVAYTQIPAIVYGLNYLQTVNMDVISKRVACLTEYMLDNFTAMKHNNGSKLVTVLGPTDVNNRGGTISIALWDKEGKWIMPTIVEKEANAKNISLRIGCFCNPGAGQTAFGLLSIDHKSTAIVETYDKFAIKPQHKLQVNDDGILTLNSVKLTSSEKKKNLSLFRTLFGCTGDANTDVIDMKANPITIEPSDDEHSSAKIDYASSMTPIPRFDFLMMAREKAQHEDSKEHPIAAVRISVGLATNFADVDFVVNFVRGFIDR